MSILTEKEIAHIAGAESRNVMEFARAIESAVLAKLAGMELPDPYYAISEMGEKVPYFTAAQLHQAFAQGAAQVFEQQAAEIEELKATLIIDRQNWSRFHHAMKDHGLHPGRTDDDLIDILENYLHGIRLDWVDKK